MKKILRLTVFIIMIAAFAGCAKQPATIQQTTAPVQQTQPAEQNATKPETDPILTQRRDAAEQYMRSMATVLWRASEDVVYTTKKDIDTEEKRDAYEDVIPIRAGRLYRGIPYSYSGASAECFALYLSQPDEKGIATLSGLDWQSLNGSASHTARVGNDCSGAVQLAWNYIGGSFTASSTRYMVLSNGFLPVGEYENDPNENILTAEVCIKNGGQTMFNAYAQLQKADAVVKREESSGHTMMVSSVHVAYNEDGSVDGLNSYITVIHQTSSNLKKEECTYDEQLGEDVYATFGVDDKYTFLKLFEQGYLPVTCDALVDPNVQIAVGMKDSEATHSFENILKGEFTSGQFIAYVTITITDETGAEVMKASCINPRQTGQDHYSFDLNQFTTEQEILMQGKLELDQLTAGNYHCTHVVMDGHGQRYTMRDFDFTVS